MTDVWASLSARLRELRSAARRAAAGGAGVSANVRGLYELRQAVDDAIDDEVIRGREAGVPWELLGSSRQQAQQRHSRAMARRGAPPG